MSVFDWLSLYVHARLLSICLAFLVFHFDLPVICFA